MNPQATFTDGFAFEIVFECLSELSKGKILFTQLDIEWKIIYIGSAEDESYDQILDSVEIGPLQVGSMKFMLEVEYILKQAPAPDFNKIPEKDLIGVTAILLTCSYNNQEFFRVGYYVNNIYDNDEMNLNLPEKVLIDRLVRNILSDKPRITKFNINWDSEVTNIPSFNNYNYMFDEGKKTSENIQNNFFPQNLNQINNMQTVFQDINNNKI